MRTHVFEYQFLLHTNLEQKLSEKGDSKLGIHNPNIVADLRLPRRGRGTPEGVCQPIVSQNSFQKLHEN